MDRVRVLIVDDHPVFRFGLRALLTTEPDFELVGEAQTGDEAIARAAELQPDVILMDLNLPGSVNGIEATRRIVRASPHLSVLVVTMFEDDSSVFAAVRAGARGYLLKGGDTAETLRAIRAVANGEAIFSPAIAQRLMQYFAMLQPSDHVSLPTDAFPSLTDRELKVLGLIARGYTNAAIAEQLVLSPKTVRNHVSNVFSKLQVADRANAVIRAREAGLDREDS